jgi:hypothetical protein
MFARAAVLIALIAAPAAAQDRFNLNCALEETNSLDPGKVTPLPRQLSIDLVAREWCFQDQGCKLIFKIALVTPDELRLDDHHTPELTMVTSIDRRTWTWTGRVDFNSLVRATGETHGPCTPAPFTPFPPGAVRKADD